MAGKRNVFYSKSIPPEHAYDIGRALVELQEQMRKLTQEVGQIRESTQRNPY